MSYLVCIFIPKKGKSIIYISFSSREKVNGTSVLYGYHRLAWTWKHTLVLTKTILRNVREAIQNVESYLKLQEAEARSKYQLAKDLTDDALRIAHPDPEKASERVTCQLGISPVVWASQHSLGQRIDHLKAKTILVHRPFDTLYPGSKKSSVKATEYAEGVLHLLDSTNSISLSNIQKAISNFARNPDMLLFCFTLKTQTPAW